MIGHTLRHGGLIKNIIKFRSGKEKGKIQIKVFSSDIGLLEKLKSWHGIELIGGRSLQKSLRSEKLDDDNDDE